MNWLRLDSARRNANPLELDLIEHYAAGKVSRRDFVRRGTIIGLSVPMMGMVIAACGGDDDEGAGDGGGETAAGGETTGGSPVAGGSMIIACQTPSSPLDPVNMLDLGTYNICSQSFEPLVGVDAAGGNIAPNALATGWTPNETADVWTFDLRPGVTWQDGSPFTSADVAATMDRLAAAGNAGLGGVIDVGSVDASDPTKAVIQLLNPNGNFPVLVSLFNAQALITPEAFETGSTLDGAPNGTGAWRLESYEEGGSARFVRNPDWWGGQTPLDAIELQTFDSIDTAVTAMRDGSIDALQQFSVIGGESLLEADDFNVLSPPSSAHRRIWMNTQTGNEFTDKLVRQAVAWCLDREEMVDLLFAGRAKVANDHQVLDTLPFFDPDAVEQRSKNVERARELLDEAGIGEINAVLNTGDIQDIPDLAAIVQRNCAEAGINLEINTQPNSTFYGDSWCPESADGEVPCLNSDPIGIVDWGHRPVPDVYFTSGLMTGGVWNASVYQNPAFDALVTEYQGAASVEEQSAAISQIQQILWEDVPGCVPYFFDYLSGHSREFEGMVATALGHSIVSNASRVE